MKAFFGVFAEPDALALTADDIDVIKGNGSARSESWRRPYGFVTDKGSTGTSIDGFREGWRGWFCGDLPGTADLPWEDIVHAVTTHDYGVLRTLNGCFAILLVHEGSGSVWAISDRSAQQPLYTFESGTAVCVSTLVSAFSRLPSPPPFDPSWLHETIYFNHPVLDRTFLEGVSRVPPASVLSWRPGDRAFSCQQWGSPFSRAQQLVGGRAAEQLELETFDKVASDYFDDTKRLAVALTAGFDSRAVLAAAPRRSDLLTYTYGRPGCVDIRDAASVAADLGIPHLAIELSDEFAMSVPELMVATVRDSDGLERVLRAELLATYPRIAEIGRNVSIGGVSGDHIFRDHLFGTGNVPHIISSSMMGYIHGRGDNLTNGQFDDIFGGASNEFRDHIHVCLRQLEQRHGDVRLPEGYQRYLVYESAPKHFGGEAALASNYLLFRSPYWDPRIVDLSFTTERATLGFSERHPKKDYFLEGAAQAGIISAGKHYGGGRIHGVRASTWAKKQRVCYLIEKMLVKGPAFVANGFRRPRSNDLLSWPDWLAGPAGPLCKELLGPDSRLRNYLDGRFLDNFDAKADLRLASRLLTAELVIRLTEKRWPPDFQVGDVR